MIPEDATRVAWREMAAEMKDPNRAACACGYPEVPCLRIVLRNGPPYPPRPCEPRLPSRPGEKQ